MLTLVAVQVVNITRSSVMNYSRGSKLSDLFGDGVHAADLKRLAAEGIFHVDELPPISSEGRWTQLEKRCNLSMGFTNALMNVRQEHESKLGGWCNVPSLAFLTCAPRSLCVLHASVQL